MHFQRRAWYFRLCQLYPATGCICPSSLRTVQKLRTLERLDILTYFLTPAHLEPKKLKPIESLEIMLQMTALKRGVCVARVACRHQKQGSSARKNPHR